jgi:SAM-dependent methyltransferase
MGNRSLALLLVGLIALAGPTALSRSQPSARKTSYIPYEEARLILDALRDILPSELKTAGADIASLWPKWSARRDTEIRARLVQGDEDSVINFMLFGTSFTRRSRITLKTLAEARPKTRSPETTAFVEAIKGRADDLVQGISAPGNNERLLLARRLFEAKGYDVKTDASRERLKQHLLSGLARVLGEQASYGKMLESARMLGDPSEEFAQRSKLFRDRGLSSDTSLAPNFAIERSLASMKAKGLLAAGSVRRVAIIGPGLDFTDKQDGYDFYPQQTIQPFAAIDSLLRLELARAGDLRVTTLDLSARVNDHLRRARARAARGISYVVQLPSDPRWKRELADYWSRFGDRSGEPTKPVPVPATLMDVRVRALKIRPATVSSISSEDVNVVLQRLDLTVGERFDLIIATNILVYYDVFEQSLALANIERMLQPGGFLLSNNALLELPGIRMRSVGYETAVYSDRANDGDHIVWYQRAAK